MGTETEAIIFLSFLCASGLAIAYKLDQWAGHEQPVILYEAIFGSFISYIYSAPPLKLKANGGRGPTRSGRPTSGSPGGAGSCSSGTTSRWTSSSSPCSTPSQAWGSPS